eukprot:TRINITY_DN4081_c0_g1_i3.p1 TRINITY_DN4081_c0_g1~~TRINITY_DN4081_c0_g1_i3.p1  ORF type:complete len:238 (-),score=38.35 TRINITY_DN4081_c0_g1_i3:229-942(-)
MAEEVVVPTTSLIVLPDNVSFSVGVLTEPLAVLIHAFRKAGWSPDTKNDSSVVIFGAGTIGLMGIVAASRFGVTNVAISYRHQFQADVAKRIGKLVGVLVETIPHHEVVSYFEGREKPDLILETVGGKANTAVESVDIISPGGTIVILGLFDHDAPRPHLFPIVCKEVAILGSNCYDRSHSTSDFLLSLSILSEHGESLHSCLVSHSFSLEQAEEAFAVAASKENEKALKVVFTLDE